MPLVPLLHGAAAASPPGPSGPWCQQPSAATVGLSPAASSALDRVPGAPYTPGECAPSGVPTFLELEGGGFLELEGGGFLELEAAAFSTSVQFRPR